MELYLIANKRTVSELTRVTVYIRIAYYIPYMLCKREYIMKPAYIARIGNFQKKYFLLKKNLYFIRRSLYSRKRIFPKKIYKNS
ncbi:hypothetical protein ETTORE_0263 [Pseudomonas phage Ettore]|nr:hypothetical protein ETTORE_0263 [Pseudomonas phage Ettore]